MPRFSWIDEGILLFDNALKSVFPPSHRSVSRPSPAEGREDAVMTQAETQHVIGLMRVNHSGEVCAQALYDGQALTARSQEVVNSLKQAALEETDHLGWCEARLQALGGRVSVINPAWYVSSFFLGAFAGLLGDNISLGFVAEVERQVEAHLDSHLKLLPASDQASFAILSQMKQDEAAHADHALALGGKVFPQPVQTLMRMAAKLMTTMSYYI